VCVCVCVCVRVRVCEGSVRRLFEEQAASYLNVAVKLVPVIVCVVLWFSIHYGKYGGWKEGDFLWL